MNVNLGLRNPVIMAVSPGSCIEGEPMSGLSLEMKKKHPSELRSIVNGKPRGTFAVGT